MKRSRPPRRHARLDRARKAKAETARCPACHLGHLLPDALVDLTIEVAPGYPYVVQTKARLCSRCGEPEMTPGHWHYVRSQAYGLHRQTILERDSYCCRACGAAGVELHVHHDPPRAQNPGPTCHAPEHMITLCILCHESAHGRRPAEVRT